MSVYSPAPRLSTVYGKSISSRSTEELYLCKSATLSVMGPVHKSPRIMYDGPIDDLGPSGMIRSR